MNYYSYKEYFYKWRIVNYILRINEELRAKYNAFSKNVVFFKKNNFFDKLLSNIGIVEYILHSYIILENTIFIKVFVDDDAILLVEITKDNKICIINKRSIVDIVNINELKF